MFTTPEPVANDEGGSDAAASPSASASESDADAGMRCRAGSARQARRQSDRVAPTRQPAAKTTRPARPPAPAPNRAINRPATSSEVTGTRNGPGAMASPVLSADQPHHPAPTAPRQQHGAERDGERRHHQRRAGEGADPEERRLDQRIGGAQSSARANTPSSDRPRGEAREHAGRAQPQSLALTRPKVSAPTPRGDQQRRPSRRAAARRGRPPPAACASRSRSRPRRSAH